ncbi:Ran-binding-domain-containing protein [Dothidotthia symphoricarpi CBS 119687]|uniref:Ran-binding-domain-containing protein n=1 Tax=Dothidotthia symphoricarpi CBS 119687 TaxID=1392245 RepID=A0A6A5ZX83_9PLEO|nr:Ran-binding-domain-containing protein [Dothidotthia symphoricarpi CBS 119687]KAF2123524.1 Ran-binding-domain-containing protein [Dothidotthia symphoricarpi CBS 119687]
MEVLLAKVTQQAMSYAIRSGIAITSTYALKQCGRLMKTVEGREKEELATLQFRLDSKIKIISPAIDMIELIAARGNTSLESAVTLTKSLRWDIQELGNRVEKAVAEEQLSRRGSSKAKSRAQNDLELKIIISDMKKLLDRIEDAVPLINLAITTSGVSLSHTLPATVSPSRLLQASTFLTSGDGQYCMTKPRAQQIGPTFFLSMYMLFAGYANRPHEEGIRETTWKEVMHKARVTLLRVPLDNVYDYPIPFGSNVRRADEANHNHIPSDSKLQEYAYQLLIVEDLDDGRMHNYEDDEPCPEPYDGIAQAGLREIVPIHEISKIFYADTGKILNIGTEGESSNPILLLKRDINATPPRRTMERAATETGYESDDSHTVGADRTDDEQSELDDQLRRESTPDLHEELHQEPAMPKFPWRLPPTLDLEWMAFEVYTEEPSTDSELDETEDSELDLPSPSPAYTESQRSRSESPSLLEDLSNLNIDSSTPSDSPQPTHQTQLIPSPQKKPAPITRNTPQPPPPALPAIKTSLSLLEMLIRLTALQQFQQSSHLAIPDEFLTFFLSESSTSGAGGDADLRRRYRREARMRVGFDPYDESPIKRRGEEYLAHEFHDHDDADDPPPFDYDAYPTRGSYPSSRSPSINSSAPASSSRPNSTASLLKGARSEVSHASSPSPLLRRATTQPGGNRALRQPSFRIGHVVLPRPGRRPETPPGAGT